MHEVYPVKKLGVTLKSKDAIVIHRLVTQREPRVSKPKREKIPVVLKPCQQCGLVLAKRKFCSGACRQAAYRQRPLSPVQVKEKQARNQARVVISNLQCDPKMRSRNGMEFDGRYSESGPSNWTTGLTPAEKAAQIYPLGRSLEFALESAQEKVSSL
jgi:hypothetical protein